VKSCIDTYGGKS
jgi:PTS system galactitol-specific IIA component